jgi:hypothetical protein
LAWQLSVSCAHVASQKRDLFIEMCKWLLQDYDDEEEGGEDERVRRDTAGASRTWPKKYRTRVGLGKAHDFDPKKAATW